MLEKNLKLAEIEAVQKNQTALTSLKAAHFAKKFFDLEASADEQKKIMNEIKTQWNPAARRILTSWMGLFFDSCSHTTCNNVCYEKLSRIVAILSSFVVDDDKNKKLIELYAEEEDRCYRFYEKKYPEQNNLQHGCLRQFFKIVFCLVSNRIGYVRDIKKLLTMTLAKNLDQGEIAKIIEQELGSDWIAMWDLILKTNLPEIWSGALSNPRESCLARPKKTHKEEI